MNSDSPCKKCGSKDRVLRKSPAYKKYANGQRWDCRACAREVQQKAYAKYAYGITFEEFKELKSLGCAVCGSHEKVVIDHDHETGRIRAALCHNCNLALGHVKDDPDRLRALAEYLERF